MKNGTLFKCDGEKKKKLLQIYILLLHENIPKSSESFFCGKILKKEKNKFAHLISFKFCINSFMRLNLCLFWQKQFLLVFNFSLQNDKEPYFVIAMYIHV